MNLKSVLWTFALLLLILFGACTVDSKSVPGDMLCPVKKRTVNFLKDVFKDEIIFLKALELVKVNSGNTAKMIQIEVLECLHSDTGERIGDGEQCAFNNLATKFTTSYKSRCVPQYQTLKVLRNETSSEYQDFLIPSGCKCEFFERNGLI